jgi:hypothetical protein
MSGKFPLNFNEPFRSNAEKLLKADMAANSLNPLELSRLQIALNTLNEAGAVAIADELAALAHSGERDFVRGSITKVSSEIDWWDYEFHVFDSKDNLVLKVASDHLALLASALAENGFKIEDAYGLISR